MVYVLDYQILKENDRFSQVQVIDSVLTDEEMVEIYIALSFELEEMYGGDVVLSLEVFKDLLCEYYGATDVKSSFRGVKDLTLPIPCGALEIGRNLWVIDLCNSKDVFFFGFSNMDYGELQEKWLLSKGDDVMEEIREILYERGEW